MNKILYNLNGRQYLEECVGVTSDAEVLWDEQVHGALPEIILGKMESYDELVDFIHLVPQLDENDEAVRDENDNIILIEETYQKLIHKLRILDNEIPSHTIAISVKNQLLINIEAQKYLASTDWYIIREMDSGVACPQDIKDARAAARASII